MCNDGSFCFLIVFLVQRAILYNSNRRFVSLPIQRAGAHRLETLLNGQSIQEDTMYFSKTVSFPSWVANIMILERARTHLSGHTVRRTRDDIRVNRFAVGSMKTCDKRITTRGAFCCSIFGLS
jgi:hypothetical protein